MISICLPTLNAREFIEPRINSILSQSIRDWELIVCDSYSDDGTWEYLLKYNEHPNIRLFRIPREGLYAGWNECLRRVRGEYIYIATADDTMMPSCLEKLLLGFQIAADAALVIGRVCCIDERSNDLGVIQKSLHAYLSRWHDGGSLVIAREALFLLLAAFGWGLGSVTGFMFKRSSMSSTGLFPTDLGFLGDAEWTLRLALTGSSVWLSDTVATWRIHGKQASRKSRPLLEAKWFHDALARVLDDPNTPIPAEWRQVSDYRTKLLAARNFELQMATGLHRCNFLSSGRAWPLRMLETLRIDARLLWGRFCCMFGDPQVDSMKGYVVFERWLSTFTAEWPPKRGQHGPLVG